MVSGVLLPLSVSRLLQLVTRVLLLVLRNVSHVHFSLPLGELLASHDYFGFPCVTSQESPILVGYITQKDIIFALGEGERGPKTPCPACVRS